MVIALALALAPLISTHHICAFCCSPSKLYYFLVGFVLVSEIPNCRASIDVYLLHLIYFTKFNIKWKISKINENLMLFELVDDFL